MKHRSTILLSLFIIPISVISTSNGTSVKTEVSTTGNGSVAVESNVSSEQNSKTEVTVNSNHSASVKGTSTSDYKKVDVTVNGEKVYHLEEGESSPKDLPSAKKEATQPAEKMVVNFPKKEITLSEYFVDEWKRIIEKVFSFFRK